MSKTELFLKLAKPDASGVSRWVSVSEFDGEFATLKLGNGGSWCRASSSLARKYFVEFDKKVTPGNTIDAIRLNGFRGELTFSQSIRKDILEYYRKQRCVMLGVCGFSENTKIEVDHKDGRKNDFRVSHMATQKFDDFQPLCKAANDIKRQICKNCKATNKRWNATNIKGNPYPFYEGDENYDESLGCTGCYQYDPVQYRKMSARRLVKEASESTAEYIISKLYPEE